MVEPAPPATVLSKIPSAIVIAGASAAGYWLAHVYEASYLEYFRIPASFVHVSTNTTLVAAGATLSTAWAAFTATMFIAGLFANTVPVEALFLTGTSLFRGFAHAFLNFKDWKSWGFEVGVALAVPILWILLSALVKVWRARKAGVQAPVGSSAAPAQPRAPADDIPYVVASPHVARALLPWIGREGLMILWVLFLARDVARDAGKQAAQSATDYFTIRSGSMVVLRAYDDSLITASFDRMSHIIGNDVVLMSLGSGNTIELRREHLGQLALAPLSPPVEPKPTATSTPPTVAGSPAGATTPPPLMKAH